MERKWLDRFTSLLPPNPSVLDLGCGSGVPIGRHLVDRGVSLTGVDASPELISIARKHVREADWIVADMRVCNWRDDFTAFWHGTVPFI